MNFPTLCVTRVQSCTLAMAAIIRFANGDAQEQFDSIEEAVDQIEAAYPGCYMDGPDCRVLCWASKELSSDDDGAKAFAEILS